MFSVYNYITMDDEQIEKFIKLYGEGDGNFSLARVLPEYAENDACENENGEGLELRTILIRKICRRSLFTKKWRKTGSFSKLTGSPKT